VYNCCLLQQNFVNTDGHFFSFEVFGFDFSQVEVAAKVCLSLLLALFNAEGWISGIQFFCTECVLFVCMVFWMSKSLEKNHLVEANIDRIKHREKWGQVEEKASQQAFGQYLGLRSQPAFLSLENKFHLLPVNRGIPSSSGEGADIVAVI